MRFVLLFFCLPLVLSAQFQDNFVEDDLAPHWEGDRDKFVVSAEQELHLQDMSRTDPAVLFARLPLADSTVWEFYFRQEFSPSTSNFVRVFLAADSEDLTANWNGYYLKLGGISGNEDALELYRRTNGQNELLIQGMSGALSGEPNQARVRVTRDNAGNWTLEADYTGGSDFQEEGTATDNTYPSSNVFGLMCNYTSSRSDKFFFDDFSIRPVFEDNTSPSVLDAQVLDPQTVVLQFDEAIAPSIATNLENYTISPNITIESAEASGSNVTLTFSEALREGLIYTLNVSNLQDLNANVITETSIDFFYTPPVQADFGDIIINEIFADPTPVIALPQAEFIELYNRSNKSFNLLDFIIADPSEEINLPEYQLAPNSYVILHSGGEDFSSYANAIGLDDFLGLGNTTDDLSLISPEGDVIDAVRYDRTWYQDVAKSEGGWTLERIRPSEVCDRSGTNWRASLDLRGGTPGQQNSLFETGRDNGFAGVADAILVAPDRLRVLFDEALDESSASDVSNYQIDEFEIMDAQLEAPFNNSVLLGLDVPAVAGQVYTLRLEKTLTDCLGNSSELDLSVQFALPEAVGIGDLRINELLFNPKSGGVDFVEFYNNSDKVLALDGLFIANRKDGLLDNIKPLNIGNPIFPASYFVISPSATDIKTRYFVQFPSEIVSTALPTLADNQGSIVLYQLQNDEAVIIDEVNYLDDWHSPLLDDENGVSLERIRPDLPANMSSSWHSAAASVGYATPTYQNSQFFDPQIQIGEEIFSLAEDSFSPNEDGFQDFLLLNYATDEVGYLATVSIFDAQGRLITRLAENELLATQGVFKWDGVNNEGSLAKTGIYILYVEYFTPKGNVSNFQSSFVLAKTLD